MEKVRLGNSDIDVSRIGLGCMGMSAFYADPSGGPSAQRSAAEKETESLHVISEALDTLGVTFLDTADLYGDNELLLAKALALRPRSSYVLATKFGAVGGGRPARVPECCDRSLARLGLQYVDLYYLHRVDPETPIEDTVRAMAELVRAGKTRAIGLSEASAATLRRAHAVHPISALQTEYSVWTRDVEPEILPTCRELGVTLVPYSPLGRGFLVDKSLVGSVAADDWRRTNPRFGGENWEHNKKIVEAVERVAQARGCTPAQTALAWLLAKGRDIVPIPGTTRLNRLRENAAAASIVLSQEDVHSLDDVVKSHGVKGGRYPDEMLSRCNL